MQDCKSIDTPFTRDEYARKIMGLKTLKEKKKMTNFILKCCWESNICYNVYKTKCLLYY